jgi:hypothetical protein
MPKTTVVFYQDDPDTAPVLDWLDSLPTKAQDKCLVRIERLSDLGHELRRPEADFLRDGFMNYGFDSEPRIIECYISSMAGLQPYWRTD